MSLFGGLFGGSRSGAPNATSIKRQFGVDSISPQLVEIEALFARVSSANEEHIERLPKTSADIETMFPGTNRAFDAVFSAALGSGRFGAICEYQDRIGQVAFGRVSNRLQLIGFDNGFPIISIQALTALYMRDWIGRQITDEEYERHNQPPLFEITSRSLTQDDYLAVIRPWSTVFGRVHPLD